MPELYSQLLGLSEKDVFLQTESNDNTYFQITGLPDILSYGKHPFSITYLDPARGQPLLKNYSNVIFEFVDSRGTIIFSNLMDIKELSGAGNGLVWIKKDPLRTSDEIADGPAYFHIMGELGGRDIPREWRGIYNVRSTFVYDIRKDFPNISPIVLDSPIDIQTNLNISESINFDTGDSVYKRSFLNVSLSNLKTNGGKIESVELAYNEQSASTDDYNIITTYPLDSGSYETNDQTANAGINPLTNTTKIPTPKELRRHTPVQFRLRFLNSENQYAQYLDEKKQGEIITVTSSYQDISGSALFIEREDNLLKGSMYTGNALYKGFEQSGKSSAFLKTVDYTGFESASIGSGSAGVMFFSGSVLGGSGDDYKGVGLELHGGKDSGSLRFRTNPSLLEIQADTFFVGSETSQFISGSGGNIEISSSLFHLNPSTNTLTLSGSINAISGSIGGWQIQEDKLINIQNTVELNSDTPGLNIKDAGGTERVTIKSGSFLTIGDGTQHIKNRSFEDDSISAGRNVVTSANSWSFSVGGKASASLTDRSSYPDQDKAVSGDVTLDICVGSGANQYDGVANTYQILQVITASFSQGDTLSFSSVARFSSSFGGIGKNRALGPQYFRLEYSSSDGWVPFLPSANYTASNGYGQYFLGTGQYNSFGASAELPTTTTHIKVVMTGSINDDSGYSVERPLYAEKTRNDDLGGKTFTKEITGSATPEYPATEITFDNFTLRSNTRKVELTEKGLLIYNSEDSYFQMTAEGIDFRGGSGATSFGSLTSRESFTNDSDVAGRLGAPALQAYTGDPEDVHATTAFDGNVGEYAKGNHRHVLPFSVVNSVIDGETITNFTASEAKITTLSASFSNLGRIIGTTGDFTGDIETEGNVIAKNYIVSSSVTYMTQSFSSGSTRFGDTLDDVHEFTGSLNITGSFKVNGGGVATTAGSDTQVQFNDDGDLGGDAGFTYDKDTNSITTITNITASGDVSGSLTSTGSFGLILQNGSPIAAGAGGSDTHVQFNDGGSLSGEAGFTYNKTTNSITAITDITASGDISSSLTSTGSFGRVETAGNIRGSRFEIDGATDYIDSAFGSLFIVTTGDIAAQPGTGKALKVTGGIEATSHITASGDVYVSGDVSGSGLGSFGTVYAGTHITASGNISASGEVFAEHFKSSDDAYITNDLTIGQYIYHLDDTDTFIRFQDNVIVNKAADVSFIKMDGDSAQKELTINDGPNDIDFVVKGESNNPLFKTEASTNRIGTNGQGSPQADFHIGGNLKVSSHITASDGSNLSGSGGNILGYNSVTATSFTGIFEGALSSSAQIASDISGSLGSNASIIRGLTNVSISGSWTAARLPTGTVSGSAQIASDISGSLGPNASVIRGLSNVRVSGSFTQPSSSFSTRVTTLEAADSSFTTDSASFSTRLTTEEANVDTLQSTLSTEQGYIDTLQSTMTSEQANIDTLESKVGQSLNTSDSPTFAGLTTTGDITARNYIVSSSVTYMTQSFSSGSTIFGDTQDDTHQFTGSLTITGSIVSNGLGVISSSAQIASNISGSWTAARLPTGTVSGSAQIASDISGSLGPNAAVIRSLSSANISGSFTQPSSSFSTRVTTLEAASSSFASDSGSFSTRVTTLEAVDSDDDLNIAGDSGTITIDMDSETFTVEGGTDITTAATGNKVTINVDDSFLKNDADDTTSGTITAAGLITSGNISGSSTSTGSFAHVKIPDDGMLSIGDSNDLQIYHNGSHTHIAETGTGNLILRSNAFQVKNAANDEVMIQANEDGAVTLYHDNTQRLVTTTGGVNITGNITGSGDLKIAGNISGSLTSTGSFGRVETAGNVRGSRFEIDGATEYIDTSLGNLFIVTTGDIAAQPGTGKALKVTGGIEATTNITGSGNLEIAGNISGSSTSTGSFGKAEVSTIKLGGTEVIATATEINYLDGVVSDVKEAYDTIGYATDTGIITMTEIDGGTDTIDIGVGTGDSPSFTGVTVSGLTATRLVSTNGSSALASSDLSSWVTGTSNQITVTDDSDGTITLSTPQDIHTSATPTFAGLSTTGNIVAQGDVIAENYIVSSSVTYMTQSFSSGSTIFGDTLDDIHEFTGSLNVTGSVEITGSTRINGTLTADNIGAFTATDAIDFNNQNMTNVDIDSGTISGITDLAVADGGTGASSFTIKSVVVSDDSSDTSALVAKQMDGSGELLIGGASGPEVGTITADDGLAVTVGDGTIELDLDLKANGGLVIESDKLALDLAASSITNTLGVGDGGTGLTTVATDNILTGNGAGALTAETGLKFDGTTLTILDSGKVATSTFISGITGDGFRITDGGSDGVSMEIDNIMVRNTLRTHIFQKDVVKATNGILMVSDSGVISGSTDNGDNTGTVTFMDDKSATFSANDRVWYKDIDENDGAIKSVQFTITASGIAAGTGFTIYGVDSASGSLGDLSGSVGGTAVRISGGSLVLDASSANSPYMDVLRDSGSTVVRTGNLAGITSPEFGTLSGHGIWASGSAFLEGSINATTGKIAGWEISGSHLGKGNLRLSSSGETLIAGNGGVDSGTTNIRAIFGKYDGTNYGMRVWDGTNTFVRLTSAGNNEIAGWGLTPTMISSSGGTVQVDAANSRFLIKSGSQEQVRMGLLNASGQYGISGSDSSGNLIFKLGQAGNEIAGWEITPGSLQYDNTGGSIALSATSQSLNIFTGSVDWNRPKVVVGKLPLHDGTTNEPYGFAVFSGSSAVTGSADSASILITKNIARLAGWELGPGKLSSGTVASIDGNKASIALGTGASDADGTPTDGLFFVSASSSPVFYVGSTFSYVDDVLTAGGWKIAKGMISSSDGSAIISGSGVLSLGSGTNAYQAENRIYMDAPNVQMSIGPTFSYGSGVLTAGGWKIAQGMISSSDGKAIISGSGVLSLGSGTNAFEASNRIYMDAPNTKFSIGPTFSYGDDVLTAGGWKIAKGMISSSDGKAIISGSGVLSLGSGTNAFEASNRIYMDAPNVRMSIGPTFSYDDDVLTAGGWKIAPTQISSSGGTVKLISANGGALALGSTPPTSHTSGTGVWISGSGQTLLGKADGNRIEFDGTDLIMSSSKFFLGGSSQYISGSLGNLEISSSNFHLETNGDVTMVGTITATDGVIGGSTITSDSLAYSPYWRISASADTSDPASFISSSAFKVSAGGQITGSNVLFTGGEISNFGISADQLYYPTTGTKIILLDGSGNGAIKVSDDAASMTFTGTQKGFLVNEDQFLVGDPKGERISWDASLGFVVSSSAFYLGGSSQYISGSGGNLEISSSGFYLDSAGNATLSGSITAADGEIGGFTIGADLDSTSGTLTLKGASGQITASNARLTGGKIAQFVFDDESMTAKSGGLNAMVIQHSGGEKFTPFGDDGLVISLGGNPDGTDLPTRTVPFVVGQSSTFPSKVFFFVGNQTGSFIEFNSDTNKLEISSSNFLFGGGGQYISGSDGNIEISSSVFHLDPANNTMVMSGSIIATDGEIGGWEIEDDKLISFGSQAHSDGMYSSTSSLETGFSSKLQMDSFNNDTKIPFQARARYRVETAAGSKNLIEQTYVPDMDSTAKNIQFLANVGTMSPPGGEWKWQYNNTYNDSWNEDIIIDVRSGSYASKDKGARFTYVSGSTEVLRIGKIQDSTGTFGSSDYVSYYGISGSAQTTGSFGQLKTSGHIIPTTTATYNLGTKDLRWKDLWTSDIQLSNEGTEGNEVDGTTGSWTIQEGEDDLYLLNRKNGKKYKFKLEEIK